MGTPLPFLLPTPDDEFSADVCSILGLLDDATTPTFAMHDSVVGAPPQTAGCFAADATTPPLAAMQDDVVSLPQPAGSFAADTTTPPLVAMHDDVGAPQPPAESFAADATTIPSFTMDDDVGAPPPPAGSFAADATTLSAFFVQEHDQPTMMPLPRAFYYPPLPLIPAVSPSVSRSFLAADDDATVGASRPAKMSRRQRQTASSPSERGGESSSSQAPPAPAAVGIRSRRQVWVRERSTEWWDSLCDASCPDAEFRRAFRMSRATFGALCDALGSAVAKEDTALRAAVPVPQRVAVCLWRLATGEPLREVSSRFGLGISTCHNIVPQVCHALATVLMPGTIRWPDSATASTIAARFEAASGIPDVVGAVYTTHVPIVAPRANVAAYYNRRLTERNQKASYSVAVQAVTDADGAFTDVCIGQPGSLSDAAVLGRSALCAGGGEAGLLGVGEQQRLVGGASYPLTNWMLVPYARQNLTLTEHLFNERVAAATGAARGAVWRLKARWRCLQRRTEVKLQDLPSMIGACCVLHNICERTGEGLEPDLMQYELDDGDVDVVAHDAAPSAAAQARDRIAHDLFTPIL